MAINGTMRVCILGHKMLEQPTCLGDVWVVDVHLHERDVVDTWLGGEGRPVDAAVGIGRLHLHTLHRAESVGHLTVLRTGTHSR